MNFTATRCPGKDEPYGEPPRGNRSRRSTASASDPSEIPLRLTPAEKAKLAQYQKLRAAGLWPPEGAT